MRLPGLLCLAAATAAVGCGGGAPTASPPPAPAAPAARAVPDTAAMIRIRFARGTTSGILNDSLPAGGARAYLLGALRGQPMLAHAIAWSDRRQSGQGETSVRVSRPDGAELMTPAGPGPLWSGRLPEDGDYVVRVRVSGGATPYTLAVQIPKPVTVTPEDPTAAYSGLAPSRAPVDFLIKGEQGRSLDAELGAGPGTYLHVYGLDTGIQLARLADRRERVSVRLPSTQGYIVSVVPAGEGTRYELKIALR